MTLPFSSIHRPHLNSGYPEDRRPIQIHLNPLAPLDSRPGRNPRRQSTETPAATPHGMMNHARTTARCRGVQPTDLK